MAVVHRWLLCRGFSIKIGIKISLTDLVWPLLIGGCCSYVATDNKFLAAKGAAHFWSEKDFYNID